MVWNVIKIWLAWVYESSCLQYLKVCERMFPQHVTQCQQKRKKFLSLSKKCKSPTRILFKYQEPCIKSLVSVNNLNLVGLKSHDCHVLMQQLLPIAIHSILPDKVRVVITRLCFFFNVICSKVINPLQLDDLEFEISIILCQLEMYFPPSFFM